MPSIVRGNLLDLRILSWSVAWLFGVGRTAWRRPALIVAIDNASDYRVEELIFLGATGGSPGTVSAFLGTLGSFLGAKLFPGTLLAFLGTFRPFLGTRDAFLGAVWLLGTQRPFPGADQFCANCFSNSHSRTSSKGVALSPLSAPRVGCFAARLYSTIATNHF